MTPGQFLRTRGPAWERLSQLISKAGRRGAAKLGGDELHELTRLYPAVAVDVARARMLNIDPQIQRRINTLAIAAHGMLYRRRSARPITAIARFFRHDYPRLFRRLWAYVVLATAIFGCVSVGAYVATRVRPAAAYLFVSSGLDVPGAGGGEVTAEDVSERYRQMHKGIMTSSITTNNIQVAFLAFAGGIAFGLGTVYILLLNGMMLGAFCGHFANHGLGYTVASFLTPHGALEIFAILVAGAAGLRMGMALAIPGHRTRGASLRSGAIEAVLLVLGTIPMFIVAGMIESFVTPSFLPGASKIIIGLLALGATLAYLLWVGSEARGGAGEALEPPG